MLEHSGSTSRIVGRAPEGLRIRRSIRHLPYKAGDASTLEQVVEFVLLATEVYASYSSVVAAEESE